MRMDSWTKRKFLNRSKGLKKKNLELGTLCDVDAAIIIFDRHGNQPKTWPEDPNEVGRILQRYKDGGGQNKKRRKIDDDQEVLDTTVTYKDTVESLSNGELQILLAKLDSKLSVVNAKIQELIGKEDQNTSSLGQTTDESCASAVSYHHSPPLLPDIANLSQLYPQPCQEPNDHSPPLLPDIANLSQFYPQPWQQPNDTNQNHDEPVLYPQPLMNSPVPQEYLNGEADKTPLCQGTLLDIGTSSTSTDDFPELPDIVDLSHFLMDEDDTTVFFQESANQSYHSLFDSQLWQQPNDHSPPLLPDIANLSQLYPQPCQKPTDHSPPLLPDIANHSQFYPQPCPQPNVTNQSRDEPVLYPQPLMNSLVPREYLNGEADKTPLCQGTLLFIGTSSTSTDDFPELPDIVDLSHFLMYEDDTTVFFQESANRSYHSLFYSQVWQQSNDAYPNDRCRPCHQPLTVAIASTCRSTERCQPNL
ncbi:hypothetical protein F0562_028225 [Nyssa sinensis]|uniref:MADS-box domain-containing protein n=1 Tax=Nyssa sinensis TaxID=561372 RepID=A0A5J5BBI5_9ASTE|nr:hypothetical protein F0562_028225 [Nyssa sinensis]